MAAAHLYNYSLPNLLPRLVGNQRTYSLDDEQKVYVGEHERKNVQVPAAKCHLQLHLLPHSAAQAHECVFVREWAILFHQAYVIGEPVCLHRVGKGKKKLCEDCLVYLTNTILK